VTGARALAVERGLGHRGWPPGFRLPPSSLATSGDFNGSWPLQSRHRNLRPPVFTSTNRMGFPHLGHRGGGVFFAMGLTLIWRESFAHSHHLLPWTDR
jgi:hypothetical protein